VNRAHSLILLVTACCHAAQFGVIPSDAAKVSPAETQHFLDMICPGQNSAAGCTSCPEEMPQSPQTWQLRTIAFGHFLSPASEDASSVDAAAKNADDRKKILVRGSALKVGRSDFGAVVKFEVLAPVRL
jgi:hypothetical protein